MDESHADGQSLTKVLITALSYSEDLTRSLGQLRHENDALKVQVDKLQQISTTSTPAEHEEAIKELRLENKALKSELARLKQAPGAASQVEHLFKQNAEKQSEIDSLKSKLRTLQSQKRKWRLLNPDVSSPIVSSDDADRLSHSPAPTSSHTNGHSQQSGSETAGHARKRPRSRSPNPKSSLREMSSNLPEGGRNMGARPKFKFGTLGSKGPGAIDMVAEDGESHNLPTAPPTEVSVSPILAPAAHNRLQNLLQAPPSFQLLPRTGTSGADVPTRPQTHFLPPRPTVPSGPEDAEPFRSRPLNRQSLSHFRQNPQYHDGLNYAFYETVRNHEARKCLPGCTKAGCCGNKFQAIAETLPRGVRQIPDDELLLEFFGQGSEAKIRGLTPMARNNLIHEARAKKIANAFGKIHRRASDRPKTPPDYWGLDVLGSQEERKSREQGLLIEREEVEKRYHEAMKPNGRWLFADE
ncbi:uncharacterized protein A1O9_12613 [Exophiala aquamarina CBS 119918]|uniref:DNA endonuclease activator Ctp1 C-terminal domain-containing protein n=1 Tax=Exophiala aquamarina CBS 119918 TaxID=1182545 RepID=A0A072NW95_9EURO|nr:uncharacterized protein A1O9_12613 [Exophiala aquamarina CBS 119918]KEF51263.1 hypothetical protein A1O9_12613 [Exophiala aquamarina CBS 119918]